MSIDIVFDKFSVQLSANNYMTVALTGNNRCIEHDSNRIARNWSVMVPACHKGRWGTLDEFDAALNKYEKEMMDRANKRDEKYNPKAFSWLEGLKFGSSYGSFGQYKGLFLGAAKKSVTVSQLKKWFGVRFTLKTCPYDCKKKGVEQQYRYPKTGRQLMRMYQELKELAGEGVHVYISISHYSLEDNLACLIRRKLARRKPVVKKTITQEGAFSIMIKGYGYLMRLLPRNGFKYSRHSALKVYRTHKEAEKRLATVTAKLSGYDVVVVPVEGEHTFQVTA